MRRDGGIHIWRDVPVIWQVELKVVGGGVLGVRDQETRATFVTHRQLQIGAIKDRYRTHLKAGVPDLRNLFFAVMNNFATYHAPGVRTRQTGGKATVIQNGIAVFATLFHQVRFTAALTTHHLVITFPDIGIFGVQIRPAFRPLEDHLVIVVMDITERINGTYRLRLSWCLFLMELHFVGLQTAVTLHDIHAASKHGVIRVVPFRVVSIDSHG